MSGAFCGLAVLQAGPHSGTTTHMDSPLRDEDLLNALPYAKGYDRELLIEGLGSSEGSGAVAALQRLCLSEPVHARSTALWALAKRVGRASTSACVEALRSRSVELQGTAAIILAEHGTADAAEAVLAWLDRRLGREHRARTWDPYELPTAIRFAVRHDLHARVARVIAKHWGALEPDERNWLRRTWPALIGGTRDRSTTRISPRQPTSRTTSTRTNAARSGKRAPMMTRKPTSERRLQKRHEELARPRRLAQPDACDIWSPTSGHAASRAFACQRRWKIDPFPPVEY